MAISRRSLGIFVLILLAVLVVGGVGGLVINTSLNQGAFTIDELQAQRTLLAEREEALAEKIAVESAPLRLEERARELGMVPQDNPAFLRLEDGAVLGVPVPQPVPVPEEPAAPAGTFVDGYLVDPQTGEMILDPQTGEPITEDGQPIGYDGESVDGVVGEDPVLDPETGGYVDPVTGAPVADGAEGIGGDDGGDAQEEAAPEESLP